MINNNCNKSTKREKETFAGFCREALSSGWAIDLSPACLYFPAAARNLTISPQVNICTVSKGETIS